MLSQLFDKILKYITKKINYETVLYSRKGNEKNKENVAWTRPLFSLNIYTP